MLSSKHSSKRYCSCSFVFKKLKSAGLWVRGEKDTKKRKVIKKDKDTNLTIKTYDSIEDAANDKSDNSPVVSQIEIIRSNKTTSNDESQLIKKKKKKRPSKA